MFRKKVFKLILAVGVLVSIVISTCLPQTVFAFQSSEMQTTATLQDSNFIVVNKTFTGITKEQIPADFQLIVSDGASTLNLSQGGDAPKVEFTESADGLFWTWKINNVAAGNYTVTESNADVDGYILSASSPASCTVAPEQKTFQVLEQYKPNNQLTLLAMPAGGFFAAALTNNTVVVITYQELTPTEESAAENFIKSSMKEGIWQNSFVFHNIEKDGDVFTYVDNSKTKSITYNASANTLTYSSTNVWSQCATGTITTQAAQNPVVNFNNNYTSNQSNILAVKNWNGGDSSNRPAVTFQLYRSVESEAAETVGATITLDGSETPAWQHLWPAMPIYRLQDLKPYRYFVREVNVPDNYTADNVDDLTVTNTYTSPLINVTANKIWNGGPLIDTEVSLQLLRDDEAYLEPALTTNLTYSWENLEATDAAGIPYVYTVKELAPLNYYSVSTGKQTEGFTVTNYYYNLEVEKLVRETSFSEAGDELHYSFAVENTGSLPFVKLTVNDTKLGISNLEIDLSENAIMPGETYVYNFSTPYTVTAADVSARGPILNTMTLVGVTAEGLEVEAEADVSVPFEQTVPFAPPVISLEKFAKEKSFAQADDLLHYYFTVKNEGSVPIVMLTVNDAKLGIKDLHIDLSATPLLPGESFTYDFAQAYVITAADVSSGKVENTLSVAGEAPDGSKTEVSDDLIITMEKILPATPDLPATGEHRNSTLGLITLLMGGAVVLRAIQRRKRIN